MVLHVGSLTARGLPTVSSYRDIHVLAIVLGVHYFRTLCLIRRLTIRENRNIFILDVVVFIILAIRYGMPTYSEQNQNFLAKNNLNLI